jgi:cardiolipin synthase
MADKAPDPLPAEHVVDGNRLRLLATGSERLDALLELIAGARGELRLLYYMFSADQSGTVVRDALAGAARRGVRVRLLVDGFGCSSVDPAFFEPIAAAGGCFCIFHPRYGRRYLIRNHQKMAVADGERALIGGANVNDHYLTGGTDKCWRDLWLSIDGPAVERLADYFDDIEDWTKQPRQKIRDLRRIITRHSRRRGAVAWKFSGPMRRRNPWPAQIIRDIGRAKRIDIVAAYFSPPNSMLRRLWSAVARGGEVRILTAAKSDNTATVAAARFTYSRLLKRGVEVYEYQAGKLHTKLYITDDAVHIGSSNFDFRSLYLNLEMMLRIEDKGFAQAMRGFVDSEVADSNLVTLAEHRGRATLLRKIKWAASNFLVTTMDYTVTRRINFGVE